MILENYIFINISSSSKLSHRYTWKRKKHVVIIKSEISDNDAIMSLNMVEFI